ncbi:MAG: histidine--tRNA ligase [Planctomycetia bacterium]|nr:histidine--tRNA ligase [Planctomycetia bacterium]
MGARIEPRTLKGFRDTMPAEAAARNTMFRAIEAVFESFGYGPIDTPALEYEEVLRGKGGDESDKQMFAFDDQGGRRVALRFDLTVPLARFVAEHQNALAFPFRRYHIGPVWRGERPQKGRYREFVQCDADLIGAVGPAADAEILTMYARVFGALGVEGFVIRVNDRRILNGLLEANGVLEQAAPVLRALDKWDKVGREGVAQELRDAGLPPAAVEGVLAFPGCAGADDAATLAALERIVGATARGREGVDGLRATMRLVAAAGVPAAQVRVDPTIARGLDYYTGVVFEAALPSATGFGSMGGGGRYDDLASLYTNTKLPGVGCSVGLTRLLVALEEQGKLASAAAARSVLVTHPESGDPTASIALAAAVRREGFLVETFPEPKKHGAQMKFADKKGLRFALTVEPAGGVHGKDLRTGEAFDVRDAAGAADEMRRRA